MKERRFRSEGGKGGSGEESKFMNRGDGGGGGRRSGASMPKFPRDFPPFLPCRQRKIY